MSHVTCKAKSACPVAVYDNVGTTLSKKTTEPLAILTAPDPDKPRHPRCLPIGSISAESLFNLGERHIWKHRRKRCDTNQSIAADDEGRFRKFEDVNLRRHDSTIYRNMNDGNGPKATLATVPSRE